MAMSQQLQARAVQLAALVLFLGTWELTCRLAKIDPHVLPALSSVLVTLVELLGSASFLGHAGVTLSRVVIAFLIGAPLAILAGFFVGERSALSRRLGPLLNLLVAIPQSMLLPMFILLFGVANVQKVVFGVTHIFFVLMLTTIAAVLSVPANLVLAARSFGANSAQIYREIYLPAMLPLLVAGMRMAMIFDVVGILLAEMYASQSGIGFLMMRWGEDYKMNQLIAGVLLIAVVTIAFNELMRALESRISANSGSTA
ncbi:MAG: ABC transporter permease [Rhodoferax sp.]